MKIKAYHVTIINVVIIILKYTRMSGIRELDYKQPNQQCWPSDVSFSSH